MSDLASEPNEINTSFSRINPRLQIAHDSTSIKAGKKCWRFYEYSIIEGWVPNVATNAHITFGWLLHAAVELYDHKRAEALSHDDAQLYVLNVLIVNTYDFIEHHPWMS